MYYWFTSNKNVSLCDLHWHWWAFSITIYIINCLKHLQQLVTTNITNKLN